MSDPKRAANGAYTVAEAAEYLRVSPRTVERLMKRKLLRRSKAFRVARIPAKDVETFYERTC